MKKNTKNAVVMARVAYGGWKNCFKLTNGVIELIVTTDVGPRIIRFGTVGGQNVMKEFKDQMGKTGGKEWRIYGGHRLWHAPEAKPRTYGPDNEPVGYDWDGKTLKLTQKVESTTGIGKQIEITLDPTTNHVKLLHRLINNNPWSIEAAVWCLSVMAPGGRVIVPQEPFRAHSDYLLPARPVTLWHYTDMADPRWTWGTKYIQLRQDPTAATPQKIGVFNAQNWVAYYLGEQLFIKKYESYCKPYPDFGCNTEVFTNSDMLEVETLSPLTNIAPDGGILEHAEHWFIYDAKVGDSDASIDKTVPAFVKKSKI
jgi:hypothetical protein